MTHSSAAHDAGTMTTAQSDPGAAKDARIAVQVRDLGMRYGDRVALHGASISIAAGTQCALLGPNGSGKSTLLRILSTLQRPSEGFASVDGVDVMAQPSIVRLRLGVVFQSSSLDGKLTVAENLRFHGHLHGLTGSTLRARVAELLARFALEERGADRAETLSGGLRRRVELARALLHGPAVLLLDEPTAGLDLPARQTFWALLEELRAESDLTVVVATHLMDEAERCDQVALLDQGRVLVQDAPARLKQELGESVLSIETADAALLARTLTDRLGIEAVRQDGQVYVRGGADVALMQRIMEQCPEQISAVRLGKPTLADVFIARTGRPMTSGDHGANRDPLDGSTP